jgi:hypothetical protein
MTFSINLSQVQNDLVQFNPLGLNITAFTEYQDFSSNIPENDSRGILIQALIFEYLHRKTAIRPVKG